ncbi:MAG: nuclear transport factor 2 family protein [Actinophytocola sp.]|nr:nuclear transport factor 2 family protein [Actinophytocola sp.]
MTETSTETETQTEHPARAASGASMAAVRAKDKQAWLALFAEDGVVEDPVGPSVFDPAGEGHHGRQAISEFWDNTVARADSIEFIIRDSFACGGECANVGTIRSTFGDSTMDAEGVFVYRVGDDGRIRSLRAFWEFDRAVKTVRPARA